MMSEDSKEDHNAHSLMLILCLAIGGIANFTFAYTLLLSHLCPAGYVMVGEPNIIVRFTEIIVMLIFGTLSFLFSLKKLNL